MSANIIDKYFPLETSRYLNGLQIRNLQFNNINNKHIISYLINHADYKYYKYHAVVRKNDSDIDILFGDRINTIEHDDEIYFQKNPEGKK